MKLMIDIPDEDYEFIKNLQSVVIGNRGTTKTIQYNVINAIKNGTPYIFDPQIERIEYGGDGLPYRMWISTR